MSCKAPTLPETNTEQTLQEEGRERALDLSTCESDAVLGEHLLYHDWAHNKTSLGTCDQEQQCAFLPVFFALSSMTFTRCGCNQLFLLFLDIFWRWSVKFFGPILLLQLGWGFAILYLKCDWEVLADFKMRGHILLSLWVHHLRQLTLRRSVYAHRWESYLVVWELAICQVSSLMIFQRQLRPIALRCLLLDHLLRSK